jgi:hypothetical protein
MTKDDIKVGQLYRNHSNSFLYLGVGKRVMWQGTYTNSDSNFTDKNLINVDFGSPYLGLVTQSPDDCYEGFWEDFYECDK